MSIRGTGGGVSAQDLLRNVLPEVSEARIGRKGNGPVSVTVAASADTSHLISWSNHVNEDIRAGIVAV